MVKFKNLDMKNDLVYKSMKYEWQFTSNKMNETAENIIENILSEDIGTTIKEYSYGITVQQLDKLKTPLEKMLSRKSTINNQFEKLVSKNLLSRLLSF